MIAPNIILVWAGTNSSVPNGFTRETTLDGLHPKAWGAENPNITGGNATHSHTSPAHSHTMSSHSHAITTGYVGNNIQDSDSDGSELVNGYHRHQNIPVAGVSGGSLSAVTSTYSSFSNDPPYYSVIFIKSSGYNFLPQNAICFFADSVIPNHYLICDGNNSTPNLTNKYLKGAETGADSGTIGGSYTNIHTLTHSHTESSHTHSQTVGGFTSVGGKRGGSDGGDRITLGHTHTISLNSASSSITSSDPLLTTAETIEPAYKKLVAIQNVSNPSIPKNIIGMWLGSTTNVPAGWMLCDGSSGTIDMRDKFLKVAATVGEINNVGGSNTHTHNAQNHSHTGGSHTHTGNGNTSNHQGSTYKNGVGGSQNVMNSSTDVHTIDTISSSTSSWNNTLTIASSSDNQPLYRIVSYIQYKFNAIGGASFFSSII